MIKYLSAAVAALSLLAATVTGVSANGGKDNNQDSGKITICHRTGSASNPYVEITIDQNGLHGHDGQAGDIIPAPAAGCPQPSPVATTSLTAACVCLPAMPAVSIVSQSKIRVTDEDQDVSHVAVQATTDTDEQSQAAVDQSDVTIKSDDHGGIAVVKDAGVVQPVVHARHIEINGCDLTGTTTSNLNLPGEIVLRLLLNGQPIFSNAVEEQPIAEITRTLDVNLVINGTTVTPEMLSNGTFTAQIFVNGVLVPVNGISGAADTSGNIVANFTASGVPSVLLTPTSAITLAPAAFTMTPEFLSNLTGSMQGLETAMQPTSLGLPAGTSTITTSSPVQGLPNGVETPTEGLVNAPSNLVSSPTGATPPEQASGPSAPNTGNAGLLGDSTAGLGLVALLLSAIAALAVRGLVGNKR